MSTDMGKTFTKTFHKPTVELVVIDNGKTKATVVASLSDNPDVAYESTDGGLTWHDFSQGINFGGYIPFYTHLTAHVPQRGTGHSPSVFLAAYAVNPKNNSIDRSLLWHRYLGDNYSRWMPVKNTPKTMVNYAWQIM